MRRWFHARGSRVARGGGGVVVVKRPDPEMCHAIATGADQVGRARAGNVARRPASRAASPRAGGVPPVVLIAHRIRSVAPRAALARAAHCIGRMTSANFSLLMKLGGCPYVNHGSFFAFVLEISHLC